MCSCRVCVPSKHASVFSCFVFVFLWFFLSCGNLRLCKNPTTFVFGEDTMSLQPRSSRQIPSKAPSHRPIRRLKRWVAPCTCTKSMYGERCRYHQEPAFFLDSRLAILQFHSSGCQMFVEKPSKAGVPCTVAWTHPLI